MNGLDDGGDYGQANHCKGKEESLFPNRENEMVPEGFGIGVSEITFAMGAFASFDIV